MKAKPWKRTYKKKKKIIKLSINRCDMFVYVSLPDCLT